MTEFSRSRNELFQKFITYRMASKVWSIGYETLLLYFDRYCTEQFPEEEGITQAMIDGWCVQRETENKTSRIGRTLPARKLIEYLNSRGLATLIIPEMPPLPPKQSIPHAFSEEELEKFFLKCDENVRTAKTRDKKFRALEFAVMFRLLYSTGIRTTEVRLLRRTDVDLENAVLNIRKSKNSIEHYVALHETAGKMLVDYDAVASRIIPDRELFFPYKDPEPYRADILTYEFHKVWDRINTEDAVPYDFRHNYAIQNINKWVAEGFDFNDKLLYLSKSMGHTSLESTRYYYSIVPALAGIIEDLSGDSFNELVPEVIDYEA